MKASIILLILLLSLLLLGCIGQKKDGYALEKSDKQDLQEILADNSSIEDVRTAIVERLEAEKAVANNT